MPCNSPFVHPAPGEHEGVSLGRRIVGSGEMAERVRGFDWASTPLGSIESWPQELVTAVNLTLASPVAALEAEALRDREAKLKAIYSVSLEHISLLTPDGCVIDANRTSLDFAGVRREDVVGKHFADTPWFALTPGAPESVREAIAQAESGETAHRQLSLNRADGETVIFDYSIAPVRDEAGKIVHLVPEGRDITEARRAETALLQSEKLAAVGRLASSIAHEINNPLESVMNLIYLARNASPEEARNFLNIAD